MSIITREINSVAIGQRAEDGYVNLTKMAQANGKLIADYLRLESTNAFLEALSVDMGIPISKLIEVKRGKPANLQGTWGHPYVVINCGQWCDPEFAVLVGRWVFDWMTQGKAPALQAQLSRLDELELEIKVGIEMQEAGRIKIWQAAAEIHINELWKEAGFKSFVDYCQVRWGWKKSNAFEVARAGKIAFQLKEAGVPAEKLPKALYHIRPLLKAEPDQVPDIWQELIESTKEITASSVETFVQQHNLSDTEATDLAECRFAIEECRILFRRATSALDRLDIHNARRYLSAAHSRLGALVEIAPQGFLNVLSSPDFSELYLMEGGKLRYRMPLGGVWEGEA